MSLASWIVIAYSLLLGPSTKPAFPPDINPVLELRPDEGVFAYARISPDGRLLAYASERRIEGRITQTINVVDLRARKVVFVEPGVDAYWSPDGRRLVFLSFADNGRRVSIRDHQSGAISRDVAPSALGDYFSWAQRDGKDTILTIRGNYFDLERDRGVMPAKTIGECPGIGTGERPLISADGRRVSTFVRGNVVIRNLENCDEVVETGLRGGKADFSFDGRFVAFHRPKPGKDGYEIVVIDLEQRSMRVVTNLSGSSLFPSWTRDGRLCFRYDGPEYRGFVVLRAPLKSRAEPLPDTKSSLDMGVEWSRLFSTPKPNSRLTAVLIWATWSAHSAGALQDFRQVRDAFREQGPAISFTAAVERGSLLSDVARTRDMGYAEMPGANLRPNALQETEGVNQMPATLLFRDGVLIDRRLGAQSQEDLLDWITSWRTR